MNGKEQVGNIEIVLLIGWRELEEDRRNVDHSIKTRNSCTHIV